MYKRIVKKMTFVDIVTMKNYNDITRWSYQFVIFVGGYCLTHR